MTRFLLVAGGGALGAMARYGLGLAVGRLASAAGWPQSWPWGTLAANLIGGLLMGLLTGWLAFRAESHQESIRLFAAVGVLGGFTTFSAFSLEVALLIERREMVTAALYVAASVILAVAALFLGLLIARKAFA
jgi:CrcB protein